MPTRPRSSAPRAGGVALAAMVALAGVGTLGVGSLGAGTLGASPGANAVAAVALPAAQAIAPPVTALAPSTAPTPTSATPTSATTTNAAADHAPADIPSNRARASRTVTRAPRLAALQRRTTEWVRPSDGVLTSTFRWRWGRMHNGIDLAGDMGTPIRAAGDGVIIEAGPESGFGLVMKIRHDDGTVTVYGHMHEILIFSGRVHAGQVIATVGARGDATGPHLHFEVRIDGQPVDPIPWLAKHGVRI